MLLFNVTYEIQSEESVEHGEAEEQGYVEQGVRLRDAIAAVTGTRTNRVDGVEAVEFSATHIPSARWLTVVNGMEFETGDYESRSLHFPDCLTPASKARIMRLVREV